MTSTEVVHLWIRLDKNYFIGRFKSYYHTTIGTEDPLYISTNILRINPVGNEHKGLTVDMLHNRPVIHRLATTVL